MRVVVAVGLALGTGWSCPADAQVGNEDPMETQRCVWRCLHDSAGVDDPAYFSCVETMCNAPAAPAPAGVAIWSMGTTADNLGIYAALADASTGNTLYYICDGAGLGYLLLSGQVEGPSGTLIVRVGVQDHSLLFEEKGGDYYAATPRGTAVIAQMAQGGMVQILNAAGYVLGRYPTPVEGNAVAMIDAQCRG